MGKNNKHTPNKVDAFVLGMMPITATIVVLALPFNLLGSTLLFFAPQAIYISWRRPDILLRSLIYSTTIAVISILTDYLAEQDQSWVSTSIFNVRIAGVVPVEAIVWLFLFTYVIVAYYQFFYDKKDHAAVGKKMPLVFFTAFAVLVWVSLTAFIDIHFTVDYYYIKFGILFLLLPLVGFLIVFPHYIRPFLRITPYFIVLGMLNLLVSLDQGHWAYPGQNFVGWVELGPYRFPIEELVFWIILYPSFLISQFELFNNDHFVFKKLAKSSRRR